MTVEYNGHDIKLSYKQNYDSYIIDGTLKKKFWKNDWCLFDKTLRESVAFFSIKTRIPFLLLDYKMNVNLNRSGHKFELNYQEKTSHVFFNHENVDYLIVFHKGNKVSLFRNGVQFAAMIKKPLVIAGSQEFIITSDSDVDLAFLTILICVIIITMYQGPEDSDFTLDLGGYLTNELIPFNEAWAPKDLPN